MNSFLSKAHDQDAVEAFSCKSWDELRPEAERALEAFESHERRRRSWRNPFEAADRAGGAVARRIEFLVELVPNGEYSFALAGGLKLLCSASEDCS